MAFYYLAASLPALSIEGPVPIGRERFLEACAPELPARALADVVMLLEGREREASHAWIRAWVNRDTQLRNALARLRSAKADVDEAPYLREHEGFEVFLEKSAAEIMGRPNPLERELALDRLRWKMAESMAAFEPFGLPAIFSYALRLRIALRWSGLTPDRGREAVRKLIDTTMQESRL